MTEPGDGGIHSFAAGVVQQDALGERVAQALRRAIILHELPPGLHVPEPVLAERYGVSRLPVRDALSQLEHEGLVRIEPRRGAFVVGFSEEDLAGLYDCRGLLEIHAVRRAASLGDDEALAMCKVLAGEMQMALAAGSAPRVADCDLRFHRQLVRMSGNRMLFTAWEPLAGLIATIVSITNLLIADLDGAVASHSTLVQALEDHDQDRAAALLHIHLTEGQHLMLEALRAAQNGAA